MGDQWEGRNRQGFIEDKERIWNIQWNVEDLGSAIQTKYPFKEKSGATDILATTYHRFKNVTAGTYLLLEYHNGKNQKFQPTGEITDSTNGIAIIIKKHNGKLK